MTQTRRTNHQPKRVVYTSKKTSQNIFKKGNPVDKRAIRYILKRIKEARRSILPLCDAFYDRPILRKEVLLQLFNERYMYRLR